MSSMTPCPDCGDFRARPVIGINNIFTLKVDAAYENCFNGDAARWDPVNGWRDP